MAVTGRQGFLPGLCAPWESDPFDPQAPGGAPARALPDNRLLRPLAEILDEAPPAWQGVVSRFRDSAAGRGLCEYVDARVHAGAEVYPDRPLRALPEAGPSSVRVIILGQDPYHGPGEAEGLAFSVAAGVRIPPSLRNVRKELQTDLGAGDLGSSGSLTAWIQQGVLLLNTALTVERDRAGSHAKRGWEHFTDAVIEAVAADARPKVFLLWGAHAQAKAERIEACGGGRHQVLSSNHPSPLSATRPPIPFLSSRPFSRANDWLREHGDAGVDWLAPWSGDNLSTTLV